MENLPPNSQARLNRIGCFGCLGYTVLYLSVSMILASFGSHSLWAWGIMIIYVLLWGAVMYIQIKHGEMRGERRGGRWER